MKAGVYAPAFYIAGEGIKITPAGKFKSKYYAKFLLKNNKKLVKILTIVL